MYSLHEVTPQEWLALIAARAPDLRSAGVLSVEIDGTRASFRLAPDAPIPPVAEAPDQPAAIEQPTYQELNPLDDPDTFGGAVPGYEFDKESDE